MAVLEGELIDLRLDVGPGDRGILLQGFGFDLVIEVSDVSDDGVVLHLFHVLQSDDALVAGGGDVDVHVFEDVLDPDHLEALHAGLECADGVAFCDVDPGAAAAHGLGAALADVSEAADEDLLAADHDVGGPVDPVDQGVLAPVDVVELGLGHRVVDVEAGALQFPLLLQLVQPAHAGGGLLGDAGQVLGQF